MEQAQASSTPMQGFAAILDCLIGSPQELGALTTKVLQLPRFGHDYVQKFASQLESAILARWTFLDVAEVRFFCEMITDSHHSRMAARMASLRASLPELASLMHTAPAMAKVKESYAMDSKIKSKAMALYNEWETTGETDGLEEKLMHLQAFSTVFKAHDPIMAADVNRRMATVEALEKQRAVKADSRVLSREEAKSMLAAEGVEYDEEG